VSNVRNARAGIATEKLQPLSSRSINEFYNLCFSKVVLYLVAVVTENLWTSVTSHLWRTQVVEPQPWSEPLTNRKAKVLGKRGLGDCCPNVSTLIYGLLSTGLTLVNSEFQHWADSLRFKIYGKSVGLQYYLPIIPEYCTISFKKASALLCVFAPVNKSGANCNWLQPQLELRAARVVARPFVQQHLLLMRDFDQ